MDEVAVFACESHRLATRLVDERNDFLIHQPAQHHFHHVQRLVVGDAHALDKLALLADFLKRAIDLRATSMHDDRVHADQLQERDVFGEVFLQRHLRHRVAAVFDDDVLVPEAADIGQRLNQHFGLLSRGNTRTQQRLCRIRSCFLRRRSLGGRLTFRGFGVCFLTHRIAPGAVNTWGNFWVGRQQIVPVSGAAVLVMRISAFASRDSRRLTVSRGSARSNSTALTASVIGMSTETSSRVAQRSLRGVHAFGNVAQLNQDPSSGSPCGEQMPTLRLRENHRSP